MSPAPIARQQSLATPAEVAAFLGDVSEKTLANWRSDGKGPTYLKLGGGLVRYDWADVKAWVAQQRIAAGAA